MRVNQIAKFPTLTVIKPIGSFPEIAQVHFLSQLHRHGIDFTLVDPKTFFYHKNASVRAVVQPDLTEKLALDYKDTFGDKFTQVREGLRLCDCEEIPKVC